MVRVVYRRHTPPSAHEPTKKKDRHAKLPAAGASVCVVFFCVDVCRAVCAPHVCGLCVGLCAPHACELDCIRFILPSRTRLNHDDGCSPCLGRIGQSSAAGIHMYMYTDVRYRFFKAHAAVCVRRARMRSVHLGWKPLPGKGRSSFGRFAAECVREPAVQIVNDWSSP